MLSRVLEPELMDSPEAAIDYDEMDFAEVNTRFVEDFLAFHGPCRSGPILDFGTGTARIPIQLCVKDKAARILAIDLAQEMLRLGEKNVAAAGLGDRIILLLLDAKSTTLQADTHEAVISNSIVHHIPEPVEALREMVRLVAPGGTLFVRDLARPASQEELEGLTQQYTGQEKPHSRQMFADSLHAALDLKEMRQLVASLGYAPEGVTMTSDRHWTWAAKRV